MRLTPLIVLLALLAGCASKTPPAIGPAAQLPLEATSNPNIYTYRAPDLNIKAYGGGILVEPATIHGGADADFGDISYADRQKLVARMNSEFRRVLGAKYKLVAQPGPGVVRLKLALIGAKESKAFWSTALRLGRVGLARTAVRSATDQPAGFTGSITVSGAVRDSVSDKVLGGVVARVDPPAYRLDSGLTPLRAAEMSITLGAEKFRDYLDELTGK